MRTLFIQISLVIIVLSGCKQNKINVHSMSSIRDTIHIPDINPEFNNEKLKHELLESYYLKFGIVIPKYYLLEDSLAVDLNGDKLIDTLIVLSPISLENIAYSDCNIESIPHRLLIEIINHNNYCKIRNVYDCLISNIPGFLSKFNGLYLTSSGFKIVHQSGARFSWTFTIEISTQFKDSIFLERIEKKCSFEGKEKVEESKFHKGSLHILNIIDTIKSNCSCDSAWKILQHNNL
jgi:hypothetical protein